MQLVGQVKQDELVETPSTTDMFDFSPPMYSQSLDDDWNMDNGDYGVSPSQVHDMNDYWSLFNDSYDMASWDDFVNSWRTSSYLMGNTWEHSGSTLSDAA